MAQLPTPVIWGTEPGGRRQSGTPQGLSPEVLADLEVAIATGVVRGMGQVLGQLQPLLLGWWVSTGPARHTPTRLTDPLLVISTSQAPLEAVPANPLRRGATIQNIGGVTIVIGKSTSVGQPGQPDQGIQVVAGGTLALNGGEWTEAIYWGTLMGAGSPSKATIHEEIVQNPPPWLVP